MEFNRALSPELRADLGRVLDLALQVPDAPGIVPIMERVARAAAAERVRPEEMIVCVKGLWMDRLNSLPESVMSTEQTWTRLVRTMIQTYYQAVGGQQTKDEPNSRQQA
jgi:hypothetical protein